MNEKNSKINKTHCIYTEKLIIENVFKMKSSSKITKILLSQEQTKETKQ